MCALFPRPPPSSLRNTAHEVIASPQRGYRCFFVLLYMLQIGVHLFFLCELRSVGSEDVGCCWLCGCGYTNLFGSMCWWLLLLSPLLSNQYVPLAPVIRSCYLYSFPCACCLTCILRCFYALLFVLDEICVL